MNWLGILSDPAAFLALGFVIGMAHALEADHLAAVATFANKGDGRGRLIARGALWGLGHTTALFVICSVVVMAGLTISGRVEAALEGAVGVMIVLLGLRVLWKMRRDRIHLHVHSHGDQQHIHLHSHAGEAAKHGAHAHRHRQRAMVFGIGLVHGAAGSAGLLVLTVATADTVMQALGYFALFGVGAMAGMAALSAVASYPLGLIGRSAGWLQTATGIAIAALALGVGSSLVIHSFPAIVATSL